MNVEPRRKSEDGFTLMEVALAISILAVMITMNYQIVRSIIQAKQVLDDRRDGMFIANSVLTRLSRELQLAVKDYPLLPSCGSAQIQQDTPPNNAAGGPAAAQAQNAPRFVLLGEQGSSGRSGRGDSIAFLAREAGQYVPDGGTHSGVVQISYRVEQNPDSRNSAEPTYALIREEVPYRRPLERACSKALRFPITQNLLSLEFQYFDSRTNEWVQTWDDARAARLPSMVQFSVKLLTPNGEVENYTSAVPLRVK
jgi:prepilin-type N-terminal cleavage/methylation domain-containing protein